MKLILFLFAAVLIHWALNNEPKPNTSKIVEKMYLDSLERSYIIKSKALRVYMPLAIECNKKHKKQIMREINDIYKIRHRSSADFRGALRNERRFEYNQRVFIGAGYGENIKLYPAIIKGVKDDRDDMNPTYIYDVQIPNWVVEEIKTETSDLYSKELSEIPFYKFRLRRRVKQCQKDFKEGDVKYRSLCCDRIFTSVEQAKESVLKNHEVMTKLNRENIDRYFDRFDKVK